MSTYEIADALMYELISKREMLNRISSQLNNGIDFFDALSLKDPKLHPAELGLLRVVSWLYVHLYEVGKININFLVTKFGSYGLDADGRYVEYTILVNQLRTYFQHNLDPNSKTDKQKQSACESWFQDHCGTPAPDDDDQWLMCLTGLLNQSASFFSVLVDCIRHIEQDESVKEILEDWDVKRKRYHPPHEFDRLIEVVIADIGRPTLDIVKLRTQYYHDWSTELQSLVGNYDFQTEARRLIEHSILTKSYIPLPIDGRDIMKHFNIESGKMVGTLLESANKLYNESPCTAEELLDRLHSYYEKLKRNA